MYVVEDNGSKFAKYYAFLFQLRELVTNGESQKGLLCLIEKKKYLQFTVDGNENPEMKVNIVRYS